MHTGRVLWNRTAVIYERVIRKDAPAYAQITAMIRERVRGKRVLEIATGSGILARGIACAATHVLATDFSPAMIARAKALTGAPNLTFAVEDACGLTLPDRTFDVVVIANALHIMPRPQAALLEIRRVLKPDGLLIAPTFTHAEMGPVARLRSTLMRLVGFPLSHAWSPETYLAFLAANGWQVSSHAVLQASFPLTYAECVPQAAPRA